jgi:LysR family glycine cleavage system transcriptional activator
MVPLCSPALRARMPTSPGPADLRALPLLHSRNAVGWGEWFARFGLGPPPGGGLRFDRSHVAIDAACEGHGVVLESDLLTQAERRQGLLVPALEGAEAGLPSVGYALVLRPGPLSQPARLFLAWLRAEAAA